MRRLIHILILASLLALSGCASPTPAPTATLPPSATSLPSPTDTPIPTATYTATLLPTATATATPRPTNTLPPPSPTLETTATTTGNLDLLVPTGQPLKSWNGLPVMPGATSGAENNGAYFYVAKGSPNAVQAYYSKELVKLGYTPFATGTGKNGSLMLMFMQAGKTLIISVFTIKGNTVVMIIPPY